MACMRTVNLGKKVEDNGFNLSAPFYNFDYTSGMDRAHVEGDDLSSVDRLHELGHPGEGLLRG
jgi:hypothetical protein